jgi:hypothetical protein
MRTHRHIHTYTHIHTDTLRHIHTIDSVLERWWTVKEGEGEKKNNISTHQCGSGGGGGGGGGG